FELMPNELYAAATAPGFMFLFQIIADLVNGTVLNLTDAKTEFSRPPTSRNESVERLALQGACISSLDRARADIEDELTAISDDLAKADRYLMRCIATIHPHSMFSKLVAAFTSIERALDCLGEAIDAARTQVDRYNEAQAKLCAIKHAHSLVTEEEQF